MANTVVRSLLGNPEQYYVVPWFWSNQYDAKMKTVGVLWGYDREVVRGDAESGQFTVGDLSGSRLLALDCVNRPADFAQGRNLIRSGAPVDAEELAAVGVSLKLLAGGISGHLSSRNPALRRYGRKAVAMSSP
ncbi:oxidoreductase C-terminal domain-containing protein [Streptomyces sp. NPDC102360]|uniref:oxidoreductase C-terminal domain-containing protein n=1 Tax=Streptomyces sp. NPDC102360 TaxID=3366160 RepID=UPI00382426B4